MGSTLATDLSRTHLKDMFTDPDELESFQYESIAEGITATLACSASSTDTVHKTLKDGLMSFFQKRSGDHYPAKLIGEVADFLLVLDIDFEMPEDMLNGSSKHQ
eukprot:10912971-Lingulodinium_polyedra.AAC.1